MVPPQHIVAAAEEEEIQLSSHILAAAIVDQAEELVYTK